jgi:hypothetical protein
MQDREVGEQGNMESNAATGIVLARMKVELGGVTKSAVNSHMVRAS